MVLYASKFDEELIFEGKKVIGVRGTEIKPPRKERTTGKRFNDHVNAGSAVKRVDGTGCYSPISATHSVLIAKHYANAYTTGNSYASPKMKRNKIIAIQFDEEALDKIPEFLDYKKISTKDGLMITSSRGDIFNILQKNKNYMGASQEVVFMENITSSDAIRVVELPEKVSDIAYAYSIMGDSNMANRFIEFYIENPDKVMNWIENIETKMKPEEKFVRDKYYSVLDRNVMENLNEAFFESSTDKIKKKIEVSKARDEKNMFDICSGKLLATFSHAMSIRRIVSDKEFSDLIGIELSQEQLVKFVGIMHGAPKLINPDVNIKDGKKVNPTYGEIFRIDDRVEIKNERVSVFRNWPSRLYNFELHADEFSKISGFETRYAVERKDEKFEGINGYGGKWIKVLRDDIVRELKVGEMKKNNTIEEKS